MEYKQLTVKALRTDGYYNDNGLYVIHEYVTEDGQIVRITIKDGKRRELMGYMTKWKKGEPLVGLIGGNVIHEDVEYIEFNYDEDLELKLGTYTYTLK